MLCDTLDAVVVVVMTAYHCNLHVETTVNLYMCLSGLAEPNGPLSLLSHTLVVMDSSRNMNVRVIAIQVVSTCFIVNDL